MKRWILDHPFRLAEVLLALGLCGFAVALAPLRALFLAIGRSLGAALGSFAELVRDDTFGSLAGLFLAALPPILVAAPLARAFRHTAGHHRAWLPLIAFFFVLALPMSLPAISSPLMWGALIVAAALGWWAARHNWVRIFALLPQLVCLWPLTGHGPLADYVWPASRLVSRCTKNDGKRAAGFSAATQANPHYYGLTPVDKDVALLSGERHSFWLRRGKDGLTFDKEAEVRGNLWQGCSLDGALWLAHRGELFRVEPPPSTQVTTTAMPAPAGIVELDLVDAICDPDAHLVYISELLGGGLRVFSTRDGAISRRSLSAGVNLQLTRRSDKNLVAIDMQKLLVYEPSSDRVLDRRAAGLAAMGIDLCPADDAVAVTDFAGRLRVFKRDQLGYAFERGTFLRAPRRVAFSPDCNFLAVTSGDDKTVWILRRKDLAVVRRYSVGPGLRDLVYLPSGELAVVDACTATQLDWGPAEQGATD
jgi:hypothetical protein